MNDKLYVIRCIYDFESTFPIGAFTEKEIALKEFYKLCNSNSDKGYDVYEYIPNKIMCIHEIKVIKSSE